MGQLVLYQVHPLAQHLIHDGSGHSPKAVGAVYIGRIAHAAQGRIDGVLALGATAGRIDTDGADSL
jgi:hypothetical protein